MSCPFSLVSPLSRFFEKDFRRQQRRNLTNLMLHVIQIYDFPSHIVEFSIKSCHFQHIFLAFASLFFLPDILFILTFLISFGLCTLFFYLDGCVLSNVEYKLCRNKKRFINIIDPFLILLNKECNTINRYFYTLYFAVSYFFGCLFKFIYMYAIK